jgi:hypothetical protein
VSRVNLLGGTYLARSLIASAQICRNLYPEKNPENSAAPFTHQLTPGLMLKKVVAGGGARGMYTATNGSLFYVVGASVYLVDPTFTLTKLGTLLVNALPDTLTTPVAMQDNGNVLVITNGVPGLGWAINLQPNIAGQPQAFQLFDFNEDAAIGTFNNVPLTGGSGTGATALFIQSSGTQIVDMQLGPTGSNYLVGDTLGINQFGLVNVSIKVTAVGAQLNAFAPITDPNFLGSVGIGYVDTYLGFDQPGTRNFYTSLSNVTYASLTGNTQGQPAVGTIISTTADNVNGTYNNVPLLGGSGSGAVAKIVVSGNIVTQVVFNPVGQGYNAGDVLTVDNSQIDSLQVSLVEVNGAAFDPLFIAGKVGYPDLLATITAVHREWWLMGSFESSEVWYDAGGAAFPFQIMPGVFIQHGTCAPYSVATHDLVVFWLGIDAAGVGTVYLGAGYQAGRISTFAIEKQIAAALKSAGTISDAITMVYKQQDHLFFILTFPSADLTLVYDLTENLWHERSWLDPNTGQNHRHRANCMAFAYNLNLCGDWQNGNIYVLDTDTFTDNGTAILRQRGFPHLVNDGKRVVYDRLALDMDCGNGVPSDPTHVPQLTLEISNDKGKTWTALPMQSMGKQGEYLVQMVWHRLGMARDRVFRVSWSEPVFTALQGAWVDITPAET